MRDDTLKRLRSIDRNVRFAAWADLANELAARGKRLSPKEARKLHKLLNEEEDDGVHRCATTELIGYILSVLAKVGQFDEMTVDEWFSRLFQHRSALFSTNEADYRPRDALALAHLARRFPVGANENTDLQPLHLDDDQLGKLLESRMYETILIVGRPWMFGKYALDIQNTVGADLHFHFPSRTRPENLQRGEICSKYHRIEERFAASDNQTYRTKNHGNTRTDYGLVQVYPKYRDRLTLVMCGGCSSLGTLGAARWLSYHLRTRAIAAPPGIPSDTTMEALVKTTAGASTFGWDDPSDIELMRLYVDKYVLNFDTGEWGFAERPVIMLSIEDGSPVSLSFDGEKKKFQQGSESFLLIANMILEADKSSDQTVKVETLARNQGIWTTRIGGVQPSYAKKRLQTLNTTQLHGVLSFTHDKVQLNADVEIKVA
jgi:hypothetical protein